MAGLVLAATSALMAAVLAAGAAPAAASAYGHPVVRPAAVGPGLLPRSPSVSDAAVCAAVANKAGFGYQSTVDGYPLIVVAVAVGLAESSCQSNVYLCNPSDVDGYYPPVSCPADTTSYDRGLWQINSYYHANVSNACAFQIQCNADAAWDISDHGSDWTPWTTFTSGAWRNYISTAESAVQGFTYMLKDQADGTCLDADGADRSNGGPIWQWSCRSGNNYERWTVLDQPAHRFLLRNVATGTCLAGNGSGGSGAKVQQWACNYSGSYQQWWVEGSGKLNSDGNADAIFVNNANGLCLDDTSASTANKTPVYQLTCSGGTYEQWN